MFCMQKNHYFLGHRKADTTSLIMQLLGRVFNILRENNPDLAGDRRRPVMRTPKVLREGTKKTVFVNFMDLCKMYYAKPFYDADLISNFLLKMYSVYLNNLVVLNLLLKIFVVNSGR